MKLLIVEDELGNRDILKRFVAEIEGIKESAYAETVEELQNQLINFAPDLILLDIYLKQQNSMIFLQKFTRDNPTYILPQIIITTGFDETEYYKQANQLYSIDYLVKPIIETELKKAINRAFEIYNGKLSKIEIQEKSAGFIQNFRKLHVITALDEHLYLEPSKIAYCQAYQAYTEIYTDDGKNVVTKMSIGVMEKILNYHGFFRVSRSYLLNPDAIKAASKKRLTIEFNNQQIPKLKLSSEKIREVIDKLNENYSY